MDSKALPAVVQTNLLTYVDTPKPMNGTIATVISDQQRS